MNFLRANPSSEPLLTTSSVLSYGVHPRHGIQSAGVRTRPRRRLRGACERELIAPLAKADVSDLPVPVGGVAIICELLRVGPFR